MNERTRGAALALFVALAFGAVVFVATSFKPPPIVETDRSMWWVPLVSWNDGSLDGPILQILSDRGIYCVFVGSRGSRIRVPFERQREAVDVLRAAPYSSSLKIHSILSGPRPGANLYAWGPEAENAIWPDLASFDLSELSAERVRDTLNAKGVECGVVSYAWSPGKATLYVPPGFQVEARKVLQEAARGGDVELERLNLKW